MYDGILRLPIPEEAKIVGFADDIAIVVVAKFLEEVTQISNDTIRIVQKWLTSVGLKLAENKTEVVLISSRKECETITITVGGHEVESKPAIKYLGMVLDSRLTFKQHLEHVSEKAARINNALMRIMPNIGGPRYSRRRLYASVIKSVILYASPIWAGAMKTKSYRKKIETTYRLCALRVCSAYRTVSSDAANVIAGMVPIDLLSDEAQRIYEKKSDGMNTTEGTNSINEAERTVSLGKWQQLWNASDKGRWTYRIIPTIKDWIERKHGELNFHITQMLSGHGCFRAYLHRFKLDDTPNCPTCEGIPENAEHVYFECPRFQPQREILHRDLEAIPNPENIVDHMLQSQAKWDAVNSYTKYISCELRRLERERGRDAETRRNQETGHVEI